MPVQCCARTCNVTICMPSRSLWQGGSPQTLQCISTVPSLADCKLSGPGLKGGILEIPTTIDITMYDRFNSKCNPPPEWRDAFSVGMSLLGREEANALGKKPPISDLPAYKDVTAKWTSCGDGDKGTVYTLTYTPTFLGKYIALQLWCTVENSDEPHRRLQLHPEAHEVEIMARTQTTNSVLQIMPGDYAVTKAVFDEVQDTWGACVVDAFASEATAMCHRFFIQGSGVDGSALGKDDSAERGAAEGIDGIWGMSWTLKDERVWAHPPKHLLSKLLNVLELPTCTAEVLVCAPDDFQNGAKLPKWKLQLLAMSDDRKVFPPGGLRKVANDAPAEVARWPICVYHIPARRRFLERRNARIQLNLTSQSASSKKFLSSFTISKNSGLDASMSFSEAFAVLDKDNSGEVSVEEFMIAISKSSTSAMASKEEVEEIVATVDANGDKMLDMQEFRDLWAFFHVEDPRSPSRQKAKQGSSVTEDAIRDAIIKAAKNNGTIDVRGCVGLEIPRPHTIYLCHIVAGLCPRHSMNCSIHLDAPGSSHAFAVDR